MAHENLTIQMQSDYLANKDTYTNRLYVTGIVFFLYGLLAQRNISFVYIVVGLLVTIGLIPLYFGYAFIQRFKKLIEPIDIYAKKIYDIKIKLNK